MSLSVNNLIGFSGGGGPVAIVEQVTSGTGTGSTVAVTLPTALTNRFVFVVVAVNGTTENPTTPSGWSLYWANNVTASGDEWHAWYKVCDGTEGSTLNITKSGTNFYCYGCFSINNITLGTFSGNFSNDETSSTPTPDSLSPIFPLSAWVTLLTSDQQTVSAYPASTPLFNTQTTGGSASQPMIALAAANTSPLTSTFTPGDWTLAASEACTMRTIAIGVI